MSKIVAETILSQIKHIDPMALMAYGAKNFVSTDKPTEIFEMIKDGAPITKKKEFGPMGSVKFKVNGLKFKGYVYIGLDWSDTYELAFVKVINHNDWKTTVKVHKIVDPGIYNDMLVDVLDRIVEGKNV